MRLLKYDLKADFAKPGEPSKGDAPKERDVYRLAVPFNLLLVNTIGPLNERARRFRLNVELVLS